MNRSQLLRRVIANQDSFPYPTDGLVSYWKLDEDPAVHNTVIEDSFGSNNGVLTTNDGATNKSAEGQVGKAISFDKTDDFIDLSPLNLAGYTELTVSVWMLCPVDTGGAAGSAVGLLQGWAAGTSDRLILTRGSVGDIQFFTFTTSGPVGGSISSYAAETWEHYAFIYDGAKMIAYRNGVKSATEFSQTGALQDSQDPSLGIGGGGGSENWHLGNIDDVLLYNRALSESEVQEIYNASS